MTGRSILFEVSFDPGCNLIDVRQRFTRLLDQP